MAALTTVATRLTSLLEMIARRLTAGQPGPFAADDFPYVMGPGLETPAGRS